MVDQAEKFFRDADLARIRELEAELDALRRQQGEPVAYLRDDGDGWLEFSAPGDGFAVYREAAPRVPEGWKLVPVEPTEEMVAAGAQLGGIPIYHRSEIKNIYADMLAAAPDGPDDFDGHDCEGFPGGCERMGCPGGIECTARQEESIDVNSVWRDLVTKHTNGGACNFQAAANDLAAMVAAAAWTKQQTKNLNEGGNQ